MIPRISVPASPSMDDAQDLRRIAEQGCYPELYEMAAKVFDSLDMPYSAQAMRRRADHYRSFSEKEKVMRNTATLTEDLTRTTVKHALPYDMQLCPNGSVAITNTGGRTIFVTYAEVMNTLAREDLDPHRRRMYEAARDMFPQR